MNLNTVITIFCKLSGISPIYQSDYIDIIKSAYYYLSNRLLKPADEYTDEELEELAYAAACIAFYNYNTVIYSRENRFLSESGAFVSESGAFVSESENSLRLKSSALMMNMAVKSVRHLIDDDDFIFSKI